MHQSSQLRMEWFRNTYLDPRRQPERRPQVLDVGSMGVNGTYRELFPSDSFDYQGLDIEPGPNVDIVPRDMYNWCEIPDDEFDVVISGQAFEHVEFFWLTMTEMARVLKKDGLLCLIAPNGFKQHRYPVDCWRFFTDGMVALARYTNLEVIHAHTNCAPTIKHHGWFSKNNSDSILVARKPYSGRPAGIDTSQYACVVPDHRALQGGMTTFDEYYALKRRPKAIGSQLGIRIRKVRENPQILASKLFMR